MSQLKISIITVCFNAGETIERTIQSVCSQTHPDIEYLIIDGASTDATLDIIKKYSKQVSRLISEKDNGIFDAMNKGAKAATGDIVYFLNADDRFSDDQVVEDIVRAFQGHEERTIVFGNLELEKAPLGKIVPPGKSFKHRSFGEFLQNSLGHQAVFAKRSLFSAIGYFDCRYRLAADYDWVTKAFKYDPAGFFYIDRRIAYCGYGGQSHQQAATTRKEASHIQFRHIPWTVYVPYYFRYVLLRGMKKKLLKESW